MSNIEKFNVKESSNNDSERNLSPEPLLLKFLLLSLCLGTFAGVAQAISDISLVISAYHSSFLLFVVICIDFIIIGINIGLIYAEINRKGKLFYVLMCVFCIADFVFYSILLSGESQEATFQGLSLLLSIGWLIYVFASPRVKKYFEDGEKHHLGDVEDEEGNKDKALEILKQDSKSEQNNNLTNNDEQLSIDNEKTESIISTPQEIIQSRIDEEPNLIKDASDVKSGKKKVPQDSYESRPRIVSKVIITVIAFLLVLCIAALSVTSVYMISQNKTLQEQNALLLSENKTISDENKDLQDQIAEKEALNAELEEKLENKESDLKDKNKEVGDYKTANSKMADIIDDLKSFAKTEYIGSTSFYSNQYIIITTGDVKEIQITFTSYGTVSMQSDNGNFNANWVGEFDAYNHCKVKFTPIIEGSTTFTFTNDRNSTSFKVLVIYIK